MVITAILKNGLTVGEKRACPVKSTGHTYLWTLLTSTKKDGFLNRLFLLMIYKKEQMINACFMRLSLMFFVSDFYVMRIVIELR